MRFVKSKKNVFTPLSRKLRKIMIWNSKGGVGKTTTTINLSFALANKGRKVLMVDLGFQNNITEWLDIESDKKSIFDYTIANFDVEKFNNSPGDDAKESEFLIPVSDNLFLLRLIGNTKEVGKIIKNKIDYLEDISQYLDVIFNKYTFDYVIFDSAPEVTELHNQILKYTDEIFIPVNMEYSSLRGVVQVVDLVRELTGGDNKITRIIPTFIDYRNRRTVEILRVLNSYFADKIKAKIRICNKLSVATGFSKDIFSYDAKSKGAKDYNLLAGEVIKDESIHHNEK